jgi:hypothetical protein
MRIGPLRLRCCCAAAYFAGIIVSSATTTSTPLILRRDYFGASATTVRANSSWGVATTHAPRPENTRSVTFWGHFVDAPCSGAVWGFTSSHPLPAAAAGRTGTVGYFPQCGIHFGPSYEANAADAAVAVPAGMSDGVTAVHLVRTVASTSGPFAQYNASGQNNAHANKFIAATYTDFNPSWRRGASNRMRPWVGGGLSANANDATGELRTHIRTNQSVAEASLSRPLVQQLQQDVNVVFIQEDCNRTTSRSSCQINFNIKTFIRGVHAFNASSDAYAFNDNGQGGLIAVVGPINVNGSPTVFHNESGAQQVAWTSRGSPVQNVAFPSLSTFVIEITWQNFQGLLKSVTAGEPANVFGEGWATPHNWILLRAGYGQENFNHPSSDSSASVIEGSFASLEVISLGSIRGASNR